jgi:hypothetical protein
VANVKILLDIADVECLRAYLISRWNIFEFKMRSNFKFVRETTNLILHSNENRFFCINWLKKVFVWENLNEENKLDFFCFSF